MRRLFRHGYGFSLDWAKLVPLLDGMGDLAPELRRQLDGFIDAIGRLEPAIGECVVHGLPSGAARHAS